MLWRKVRYDISRHDANADVRYFAVNLPEELDAPGEYWVDRENSVLYYYPTEEGTADELVLTTSDDPLVRLAASAHDIVFQNLVFSDAGMALDASSEVRRLRMESCDFHALRLDAVKIDGRDSVVSGCTFRQIGHGCVVLSGGDRKALQTACNVVENCDMREYARFYRCYKAAVRIEGCGQAVRHCTIADAPHEAIAFNGNEHFFGWNTVSNVLSETSDAGAFYIGRNTSMLGHRIVGNRFLGLTRPDVSAIYFDDC